jgi:hypothetical protein
VTPEQFDSLPGWECPHGTRTATIGRGKDGRTWGALMCNGPDKDAADKAVVLRLKGRTADCERLEQQPPQCQPTWLRQEAVEYLRGAFMRHMQAEAGWKARADRIARKQTRQAAEAA